MIYKIINKEKNKKLLDDIKAKEILFNDALRLNVGIIFIQPLLTIKLNETNKVFEETIGKFNFYRKELLLTDNSEILVLSDRELNDEEFNVIINEKKESTEEENKLLRNVLIINIIAKNGL